MGEKLDRARMAGQGSKLQSGFSGQAFGLYQGEVSAVDDMGLMIKAVVKSLFGEEMETNWAAPVSIFGGKDAGIFFPPDIDDPVWIVFQNGDVNAPLYIGGRWDNDATPPDESGKQKRIIKTKSGSLILFNDDENSIKIASPNGNYIIVDDDKIKALVASGASAELSESKAIVTGPDGITQVEMTSDKATMKGAAGDQVELSGGKVAVTGPSGVSIAGPGGVTIAGAGGASVGLEGGKISSEAGGAKVNVESGKVSVEAGGAKLEASGGKVTMEGGGIQLIVGGGKVSLAGPGAKKLITSAFWELFNSHKHPVVCPTGGGPTVSAGPVTKMTAAHMTSKTYAK